MQSAVPYPGKVIRNPVNRPDPIRKRFGYGQFMAITASVQPESGRIVYAGSDFSHPFQLRFSKEGMDHIVENPPGSDLDGLVRFWPSASVPFFRHRRPG